MYAGNFLRGNISLKDLTANEWNKFVIIITHENYEDFLWEIFRFQNN